MHTFQFDYIINEDIPDEYFSARLYLNIPFNTKGIFVNMVK